MTILFASGEDTGFTLIGTAAGVTGNTYQARSGFAKSTTEVVAAFNGTTVADPPASRFQTPTFTSSSNIWIHAQFSVGSNNGNVTTSNEQALLIRSPDGVSRIVIRQTGTAGQLKVSTRNAAGTITDLGTASSNYANSQTPVAFDLNVNYVGAGAVTMYLNGIAVVSFSGDPRTDAATQLNQVEFASANGGSGGTVANGGGTGWSEIIVADEDTRGMAVWTLAPQAAGNTQSWTPNTVGNINDATINDTTLISTSSNNALSQWTTPTSPPAGSWNVKCIVQEARIQVGTTGPQHFDWSARTASTDYTGGTSNAPTTSFGNFSNFQWTTNPNTSSAWAITDIASGFNLGIKSLA